MKKYPKLRYPSHDDVVGLMDNKARIVVQEKLDGANFRFKLHESGRLLCGSRNVVFSKDGEPLQIEECNDQFRHAIEYLYSVLDLDELDRAEKGYHRELVFYGEAMHKHSIDYDSWEGQHPDVGSDVPNVVVYDIWCGRHGGFLQQDEMVAICDYLGLETAPVVYDGSPAGYDGEIPVSKYRNPDPDADTEFDRHGLAEGVVIKNQTNGAVAKLVHEDFKEKNAISFNEPSKARTEAGKFVATYVTDARIEKCMYKLVDEGPYSSIDMSMMKHLPKSVLTDVMEEEGWSILNDDIDLDVDTKGEIRSLTSKKCVDVLKSELNSL